MSTIGDTATSLAATQASANSASHVASSLSSLASTAQQATSSMSADAQALAPRYAAIKSLQQAIVAAGGKVS